MLNCPTCIQNPTGEKCEYFGHPLGMAICPYGKERPPKNHFEQIKQMTMEEMAEVIFRKFQDIYEAVTKDGAYFGKRDMMRWLMEGVDHES